MNSECKFFQWDLPLTIQSVTKRRSFRFRARHLFCEVLYNDKRPPLFRGKGDASESEITSFICPRLLLSGLFLAVRWSVSCFITSLECLKVKSQQRLSLTDISPPLSFIGDHRTFGKNGQSKDLRRSYEDFLSKLINGALLVPTVAEPFTKYPKF